MKSFTISVILSLFIVLELNAQPIPQEVKSTIAFIFVPDTSGKLVPNGTGFFVGVKDTSTSNSYSVYLVTAKHVLLTGDNKTFFPSVFVRLNRIVGDAEILKLDLSSSGNRKNVFVHPDSTVDIAVIPALPDQKVFDFKFLPNEYLTTKDEFVRMKIREGSEIFFTGLFIPHIGKHRNYPVVRFGRVALISEERVNWEGVMTELYLVESASYGGNSGSPVFFYLGAEREPGSIIVGSPVLKLAGIMKGFVGERRPIELVQTSVIPVSVTNIGIAGIVPAYQLNEILFSSELKNKRGF